MAVRAKHTTAEFDHLVQLPENMDKRHELVRGEIHEPSRAAYNPQAPDLAIEVLSPTDDAANIRIKIVNYLQAGTTVWSVDPIKKLAERYIPGRSTPDPC